MERPRLLLIDDEPALADFLAEAARESGYEPEIARSAAEFRQRFSDARPNVVALDLGMPGTDGVEFLRFLADNQFSDPVLLISGFDRRIVDSAFRLGEALGLHMAGQVEKPARLEDLEQLLSGLKPSLAR